MITAEQLTKRFKKTTALNNATFHVKEGEIFGYLGPNGAGKTTTARILACLIKPDKGRAQVGGYNILEEPEKVRMNIGLIPEVPGHYKRLTAIENLQYYGRLYELTEEEIKYNIRKLLTEMDLWEKRDMKVGTYSRGMKQKLAIARALLHNPPILILDEPTAGLDPAAQKKIRDIIRELSRKRRHTVFLCTHNLNEAEILCDRIAIINHGRIITEGGTDKLRKDLWSYREYELKITNPTPQIIKAIRETGRCLDIKVNGNKIRYKVADPERDNPLIIENIVKNGGKIVSCNEIEITLEKIYLKILGEEK